MKLRFGNDSSETLNTAGRYRGKRGNILHQREKSRRFLSSTGKGVISLESSCSWRSVIFTGNGLVLTIIHQEVGCNFNFLNDLRGGDSFIRRMENVAPKRDLRGI